VGTRINRKEKTMLDFSQCVVCGKMHTHIPGTNKCAQCKTLALKPKPPKRFTVAEIYNWPKKVARLD